MSNKPTLQAKDEASRKFVNAMKRILSVPKSEMERREANYQQERAAKKASRKSKLQALIVMAFILVSLGCASSTHYVSPSRRSATPVESVAVLFQEPKRPYDILAFVQGRSITVFDSSELLMRRAREEAAAAGADAVIFSTTGEGRVGSPRTAEGRAIKWK
jgi:hypothetical protein